MSVSSLTRFTVPLAGDQSASNQGLLMPKLKYRFRVVFENFGVSTPRSELTKQIQTFDRPSLSLPEKMIDVYNSKMYYQGKPEWSNTSCSMRDDASGAVSRLVGEQVQKQMDFMEQASASSGIDYKFTARFEVLDGGNGAHEVTALETWEFYGCFISNVNYGAADYSSDDPMTIELDIRFDNALQIPLETGIGAPVGRTTNDVVTG
jgi:hypothetical protein